MCLLRSLGGSEDPYGDEADDIDSSRGETPTEFAEVVLGFRTTSYKAKCLLLVPKTLEYSR